MTQNKLWLVVFLLVCAFEGMAQPLPVTFGVPGEVSAGISKATVLPRHLFPAITLDLNHDGYDDFVSIDPATGNVVVVLGGSNGFHAPATYPAGSYSSPVSIASGDFNKDGIPDLIVSEDKVYLLLGTGDGGFQAPVATSLPPSAANIAVGDFNGDGNPDVAIASPANQVLVVLGHGDGTFGSSVATVVQSVLSLYPGSFHNNGRQDLIMAGLAFGAYLLTSNGDGTFAVNRLAAIQAAALIATDMNGDGNLDLVTRDPHSQVQIWLGDGRGHFKPTSSWGVNGAPADLAVADVNGDGIPDVVTADRESKISILLGVGDGTLRPSYSYKANDLPVWLGVGRYSRSDQADVVVLNTLGNRLSGPTLSLLKNQGSGRLEGPRNIESPHGNRFALADMNRDGNLDLVFYDQGVPGLIKPSVSILLGRGDGEFGNEIAKVSVAANLTDPLIADFNGDGLPDFAIASQFFANGSITIQVGLQQANGSYLLVSNSVPLNGLPVWAGDLNGDGRADLIVSGFGGASVLLSQGQGTFGAPLPIVTSGNFLAVADFNDDGKPDVVLAGSPSARPALFLGNGDGTFQPPTRFGKSEATYAVATGDFNHDGNQDVTLVTASNNEGHLLIYLGDGAGHFQPIAPQPFQLPSPPAPVQLLGLDLNGDGDTDLVSVNFGEIQIYVSHGDGRFTLEPSTYFAPNVPCCDFTIGVLPGDLNNDGRPDLVSYYGTTFAIFLNTTANR